MDGGLLWGLWVRCGLVAGLSIPELSLVSGLDEGRPTAIELMWNEKFISVHLLSRESCRCE